ncbi:MAG: GNAT family N-acetyltransferase [Thermoplasmata archaeon]|nr:GNAT family N-acetyltransferase [Thermoplasmata archaeon]
MPHSQASTSDVVLRDVRDADLSIFFEHQKDPLANHMAAFTARDPTDREAFDKHWTRIRSDPKITTKTIVSRGKVVGSVAKFVDDELGKPEVTYWLGREYWGKGLATQALSAFLDLLPIRPIYGRVAKDNLASIRVLEKCGFRLVGSSRDFASARGKEIEEVLMELGPSGR